MGLGSRRVLATLQSTTRGVDSYGDESISYADIATAWISLRAMSVEERFEAQQVQSEVTHRAVLPYAATYGVLTAGDRVVVGTRVFDVDGPPVNLDERNKDIELRLVER